MRRFVSFGPALIVLAAALATLFVAPSVVRRARLESISASVIQAQARLDQQAPLLEQLNRAARDVASAVLPGVVHVQVRGRSEGEGPRFQRASAAGWFYNEQGFIVTNAHVVEDARTIRVELHDGRVREARLVGRDERTDIALLRIDSVAGINPPRRASGVPVHVGDHVFAFGSPFGIKFSMSAGIVSGLGRSEAASLVGMRSGYTNFIQTDAAMNPGNSGGPLVDIQGQVIGMCTAIANNMDFMMNDRSPQGQSAGIGFAIPVETIEAVVEQLMESEVVIRGYLGIVLVDYPGRLARDAAAEYDGAGAMVTQVREGGPADRAGLKPGDIITRVLGQPCPNSDVLRSLVSIRPPGARVPLTVWRDGETRTIDAALGAAYFGVNDRGEEDLIYIPGSEGMTLKEVRKKLQGPTGPERVD